MIDNLVQNSTKLPPKILLIAIGAIVGLVALVDIPSSLSLGEISLGGVVSIAYGVITWLLWAIRPKSGNAISHTTGFVMFSFLIWAVYSLLFTQSSNSVANIQNLVVMASFFGAFMLSARLSTEYKDYGLLIKRWLLRAGILSSVLYSIQTVSIDFMGSRAFALFALVAIAIAFSNYRHGSRNDMYWGIFMTVVIATSLSRTASVIAMIILGLSFLPKHGSVFQWIKFICASCAVAILVFGAIWFIKPINDRFFTGDLTVQVGGVGINTTGRGNLWDTAWQSYLESPWIGKGAGSSSDILDSKFAIGAVHNDYLRLLHDYGLIGFGLFAIAFLLMIRTVWLNWLYHEATSPIASLHFASFLGLIAVAASSTTDNTVVYAFVMIPLALLVGASVGQMKSRRYQE